MFAHVWSRPSLCTPLPPLAAARPDDLLAHAIRELVARVPSLPVAAIEEVYAGCANQAGEDNRNVARMALLLAGLPLEVPGVTVNRLCGSGLDALGTAARAIRAGEMFSSWPVSACSL